MEPPQHYRDQKPKNTLNQNFRNDQNSSPMPAHRHVINQQEKFSSPSPAMNSQFNGTNQQSFFATPAARMAADFRSPSPQNMMMPPSFYDPNNTTQFVSEPVAYLAKAYGGQIAEQGKQQFEKYVSVSQLKYYFDVDNLYVGKKLALLLFPFAQKEWSVQYSGDQQPLSPRYDVNAPDLYIPVMAFVTYIVMAGVVLGTQNRFSPEQLGVYASSAFMWLFCENFIVLVVKYLMNISQSMKIWDTLAFCGYKFFSMNICLIVHLCFLDKFVYLCVLGYASFAIVFFLIRSVKGFVLENHVSGVEGRNRKLYLLLFICLSQPFIIWWLTSSLTNFQPLNHNQKVASAPKPAFALPADFEM